MSSPVYLPQTLQTPFHTFSPPLLTALAALGSRESGRIEPEILQFTLAQAIREVVAKLYARSPRLEKSFKALIPSVVLGYAVYVYVWKDFALEAVIQRFHDTFTYKITLPGQTGLHEQVLAWVSRKGIGEGSRSLAVLDIPADKQGSLSYVPAAGHTWFKHKGNWLRLELTKPSEDSSNSPKKQKVLVSDVVISHPVRLANTFRFMHGLRFASFFACLSPFSITNALFGGGAEPIKSFLSDIETMNSLPAESSTLMFRLAKHGEWKRAVRKPVRDLDSVSMEETNKTDLLQRVEQYLSKDSREWYAKRGIPYRYGLLFHGPPGTGKTSISLALAGHFKLNLYILSIVSSELDDASLEYAFDELPEQCIVLLEDVDTAGIQRESMIESTTDQTAHRMGITLSGLLNVIDGPCSAEGRLLIMTTNQPDQLDSALRRPGRIDHDVYFGNANREVVQEIFMRIYSGNETDATASGAGISKRNLEVKAARFASKIPEDCVTPADVQNYLLTHRNDPDQAVTEVEEHVRRHTRRGW